MVDGIKYAILGNKTEEELLKEISKKQNEYYGYLEKDRVYRSEEDVFEYYSNSEREEIFGKSPVTVWDNIKSLDNKVKTSVLQYGDILTDIMIKSFKTATLEKWKLIICKRKIKEYFNEISSYKRLNSIDEKDNNCWDEIEEKRKIIYKNTNEQQSLFGKVIEAFEKEDWKEASRLVIELEEKMEELRSLYYIYKKNIIEE